MMMPVIADTNFNRLGVIDEYKSFIWTNRYYAPGDFEICTGLTPKSAQLLQANNYVLREDDENVGIIEKIEINVEDDQEMNIIASGRFLSSILGRRIIAQLTQINGKVSDCIYQLINDAIISPSITERQISNFVLGDYVSTATMSQQFTGKNLLVAISEICELYDIGYKVLLNDSNQFVFNLYEGTDRSYDQDINPFIVFSDKYENLLTSQYQEDRQKIATNVLIAGEGEGTERKTLWVTKNNPTGLSRYELYEDARNINTNNGEISDTEYFKQLEEQGKECITNFTTAFAGVVDFTNVNYKTDVNLGDICSIENSVMQKYINARLIEVIESVDESGKYQTIPTFGL